MFRRSAAIVLAIVLATLTAGRAASAAASPGSRARAPGRLTPLESVAVTLSEASGESADGGAKVPVVASLSDIVCDGYVVLFEPGERGSLTNSLSWSNVVMFWNTVALPSGQCDATQAVLFSNPANKAGPGGPTFPPLGSSPLVPASSTPASLLVPTTVQVSAGANSVGYPEGNLGNGDYGLIYDAVDATGTIVNNYTIVTLPFVAIAPVPSLPLLGVVVLGGVLSASGSTVVRRARRK